MIPSDWRALHERLLTCEWFTYVGEPSTDDSVLWVKSWDAAAAMAAEGNSWYCANVASNLLSGFLHDHHNALYQMWNRHIESFAPVRDDLMIGSIVPAIPPDYRTVDVFDWIRSQLTRAYLECVYSPISDIRLACRQLEWYLKGRFPCGWRVETEDGFPHLAMTVVF